MSEHAVVVLLGACLLCFVPLTVESFQVPDSILWTISSLCLLAFCASYFVYTTIKLRKPELHQRGVLILWVRVVYLVCLALASGLQALNAAAMASRAI
jgi:hypothetical protein